MAIIMGVDGGGSKTYTVITDSEGKLYGEGLSEGANYQKIGLDAAVRHIDESMKEAMAQAGLKHKDISFVQYALAGADREIDFVNLRAGLAGIPVLNWDIVCDTLSGLRSGSPNNVGVVLVCGSGTNAVGRSKSGKFVQTGGFGFLYGDSAGGKNMAIETFRAAVRSWEQREMPSILVQKIPRFFNFDSMEELLNDFLDKQIYSVPGELTIVLHEAVNEGDPLAIRLLTNFGRELGIAANSVMKRIGDFGVDEVPIVLIGSVFQRGRNSCLLFALEETIRDEHAHTRLVIPEMEPVYGAVLLGMDKLHIEVTPRILKRFNSYRRELGRED